MVDSTAPSVFAHRVLLAWDYSFLDDGERANRRSRTVTMNRAMAEDVFRTEDLAQMLSQEAVDRVAAEIGGRAPSSRARNADELYELIRAHGSLRPGRARRTRKRRFCRSNDLRYLAPWGRVVTARVAEDAAEMLLAAEDLASICRGLSGFRVVCPDGAVGSVPPSKPGGNSPDPPGRPRGDCSARARHFAPSHCGGSRRPPLARAIGNRRRARLARVQGRNLSRPFHRAANRLCSGATVTFSSGSIATR